MKKFVLLIGMICLARSQSLNTVSQCLTKITADDSQVGQYSKAHVATPTQGSVQVLSGGRLLQMAQAAASSPLSQLLKSYFAMNAKTQQAIKDCKPNGSNAMKKCEAKHGTGQCEQVAPGLANKKCPAGLERKGHSVCTVACPEGWIDRGLDCYKPKGYKTLRYKSRKECRKASKKCQKFHLMYWVPRCRDGFIRHGSDACVPGCPEGWMDLGRKCMRPTVVNVGEVFTWVPKDN
jgi:hypothetical protein